MQIRLQIPQNNLEYENRSPRVKVTEHRLFRFMRSNDFAVGTQMIFWVCERVVNWYVTSLRRCCRILWLFLTLFSFTNGFKLFLERKRTLRILLHVGTTACKFHRTRSLNDYYCLASLRQVRVSEHNYVSYCSPILLLAWFVLTFNTWRI